MEVTLNISPFQLIDARATMALYRLHKKEWEASKQGIPTKTSPSIFLQFYARSTHSNPTCTGAKNEPATTSDHATPRRAPSGMVTAVNKEVSSTSGKAIVKAVKQSANVKVASGETKSKDKRGAKESWWQDLE